MDLNSPSFDDESTSTSYEKNSILIIGATSRTGMECIHQLAEHPSKPIIHAFCENPSDLDENVTKQCASILEGSVRHAIDIEEALEETGANWVVFCGDASDDNALNRPQKNLKTVSATNIARVLNQPAYQSVRVLVVSRIGRGTSHVKLGLRGSINQMKGRQVLLDYAGQELALRPIWNRTTVVRTTQLTDSLTSSGRRIVELCDNDRLPTLNTERADLAACIVDEICARPIPIGNRTLNVTSAKL